MKKGVPAWRPATPLLRRRRAIIPSGAKPIPSTEVIARFVPTFALEKNSRRSAGLLSRPRCAAISVVADPVALFKNKKRAADMWSAALGNVRFSVG